MAGDANLLIAPAKHVIKNSLINFDGGLNCLTTIFNFSFKYFFFPLVVKRESFAKAFTVEASLHFLES